MNEYEPARLETTVEVRKRDLTIRYVFHNGGDREVGLFNRLSGTAPDGSTVFEAGQAYVDMVGGDLHVSKMALPLPRGLIIGERVIPAVTRVPGGGAFQEEISLDLPIKVNQPYTRLLLSSRAPTGAFVDARRAQQADAVVFSLGFFLVDEGTKFRLVSPAYPDVWRVALPDAVVRRQIVLSERIELEAPVEVLDYEVVVPADD